MRAVALQLVVMWEEPLTCPAKGKEPTAKGGERGSVSVQQMNGNDGT